MVKRRKQHMVLTRWERVGSIAASRRVLRVLRWLCAVGCATGVGAWAEGLPPVPGEYITDPGWGVLTLRKDDSGHDFFQIRSRGINGHACTIDGEIRNGQSVVERGASTRSCNISFSVSAAGVEVHIPTPSECRDFCGARASFDGSYLVTPPGCTAAERFRRSAIARAAEKVGDDDMVRATLEPLLNECRSTMVWQESDPLRNQLGAAQEHLGRYADCIGTLAPVEDEARAELDLFKDVAPTDYETLLPIVKAAQVTLQQCRSRSRGGPR